MQKVLTTFAAAIDPKHAINSGQMGVHASEDLTTDVTSLINVVIGLLGILAVVVIILGGVQYMLSNGDSSKVKKAKDTILYGVIGLVIVILAAAIVNFIIAKVATPTE